MVAIADDAEGIDNEESEQKRLKTEAAKPVENETITLEPPKAKSERCNICKQYLEDITLYDGHPNKSVEEFIALTDERLMLFTGTEESVHAEDERATNKITYFNVYDRKGHLVPFDSGLIEQNVLLYVSGYVKPIYAEDDSPNNGVPAFDIGPINAWFISGYDGGKKGVVFFSTPYAEYYLMAPSEAYAPLMQVVNEKITLSKLIIEFLMEYSWKAPAYEDLLQRLQTVDDASITEESIIRHAQFICDQVVSFDAYYEEDTNETPLIATPCMRSLIKIAGVTFKKRKWLSRVESKGLRSKKIKAPAWSKATTTNLVKSVFENFFTEQIANAEKDTKGPKKKRCGVCDACQQPDCGCCNHCRDMLKFGGTGRSKQACKLRRCPYMAIQQAEESDNEEEDKEVAIDEDEDEAVVCSKRILHKVRWASEAISECNGRSYYDRAQVGDLIVNTGDFVILNPAQESHALIVAEVAYMWEEKEGPMFHADFFIRGSDTILGETSDPREIFVCDVCTNCALGSIVRHAKVEYRRLDKNWALNGGLDALPEYLEDDGETFYFSKRYDSKHARFEDLPVEDENSSSPCNSCTRKLHQQDLEKPTLINDCIKWRGEIYRVGSGVYLKSDTFDFDKNSARKNGSILDRSKSVDTELYPEYYRKINDNIKGSNSETPRPFCIGLLQEIITKNNKLQIRIVKFYRPENTSKGNGFSKNLDLNLIYYSNEDEIVAFSAVQGKCYISYGDILSVPPSEWIEEGPNRFYFNEAYNAKSNDFEDVPTAAMKIGMVSKAATGKLKNKSKKASSLPVQDAPVYHKVEPLNCLDVFAGCGGLSEGLHQAGIAKTLWAIEKDVTAAQAFKLNNPDTKVFSDDCNALLAEVMEGKGKEKGLPEKGEVQMLVGGPPCQGFSGMNRFNAGQYSLFKNSLIVSLLSYCDYYRPKYFILENVRNFVSFKKSLVLKLTVRCLVAMGYQVTFGVVQAGHYGVPQTRRRLIILASAPGCKLPQYPEPLHVFNKRGCQLDVQVGEHRYTNGTKWTLSAPLRTITVRDAMGDLPEIKNGYAKAEIPYDSHACSHFQRSMRGRGDSFQLTDHVCKDMAPLVEARIMYIPLTPGSDWRDLPNLVVRLKDGTYTNKLRYPHRMRGQSLDEAPKGVCQCATKKGGCDPTDRQFNTLIPWCLPHTADRHNHWSGLYGRLEWDGFFSTTVTNPEPMGKQGRVLHPDQHRVVSVRECARSQGFPDRYQFAGSILDKHRQVGNAVPPPLAKALGREICKAFCCNGGR